MSRAGGGAAALLLVAQAFACARPSAAPDASPSVDEAQACAVGTLPVVLALEPDSVSIDAVRSDAVTVEVRGCRFDPEANEVRFGPAVLRGVGSTAGGTRLRFVVPQSITSGTEAPPMVVQPGEYPVTVTSAAGRSEARPLTIY